MAKNNEQALMTILGVGALAAAAYYFFVKKKEDENVIYLPPEKADKLVTPEDLARASQELTEAQKSGFVDFSEGFKKLAESLNIPIGTPQSSPVSIVVDVPLQAGDHPLNNALPSLLDRTISEVKQDIPQPQEWEVYETRTGNIIGTAQSEDQAKIDQREAQIGNSENIGRRPKRQESRFFISETGTKTLLQKLREGFDKEKVEREARAKETREAIQKQTSAALNKVRTIAENRILKFEREARERRENVAKTIQEASKKLQSSVASVKAKTSGVASALSRAASTAKQKIFGKKIFSRG